jgi:hypothetical protein
VGLPPRGCGYPLPPPLQGQLAFGAAGLENFGRWLKRQGGACTVLDCELAGRSWHMAGHCLLQKQSPFSCGWPVLAWAAVISTARPRTFVIWRAGCRCSGRRARRKCRGKGFPFSELARRPAQLHQPGGRRNCAAGRDRVCVDITPQAGTKSSGLRESEASPHTPQAAEIVCVYLNCELSPVS